MKLPFLHHVSKGPRRKLYVHAGVHRTGTTYVQQCMFENRELLARHGLIYPFETVHHHDMVNSIKFDPMGAADAVAALRAIRCGPTDAILLSCEDFCSIPSTEWLTSFAEAFDVSIIFYMRRQDHWINSWYNLNTKWPFDKQFLGLTPHEYLDRLPYFFWIDYAELLDKWAAIIGKRRLLLGVVGRGQLRDVVPDLLAKVGLPGLTLPILPATSNNESVSPYAAEILRHVLPKIDPTQYYYAQLETLKIANELYPADGSSMIFSPNERRRILRHFSRSNNKTARKYMSSWTGRLFQEADVEDAAEYTRFRLRTDDPVIQKIICFASSIN